MKKWWFIISILLIIAGCSKEPDNPFDDLEYPQANPNLENLPQDNFAWLHQKIFKPTCANSGCHDGNFEPDYRTISSAYNSLVFQPVISNDANGTYTYRVQPGNDQLSLLMARLTTFIPNTSGMMPLELDSGSDWPANSSSYKQKIADWINAGAKDMFGNSPTLGNLEPQVTGLLAFPAGSTAIPYPRGTDPGVQPIEVPAAQIDLWFNFDDDTTPVGSFTYNKMKASVAQFGFTTVPEQVLFTGASTSGLDFSNNNASFTHKGILDLSTYPVGTYIFVRVYVDDGDHNGPTEIPSDGTNPPLLDYFTLLIVP